MDPSRLDSPVPASLASKGLYRISPPAGVKLPPNFFLCNDFSVYDESGQFRGKIQRKGATGAPKGRGPAAAAANRAAMQQQRSQQPNGVNPALAAHIHASQAAVERVYHPPSIGPSSPSSVSSVAPAHPPVSQPEAKAPPALSIPSQSQETIVVDGRDFGLPFGHFISTRDGRVFNAEGKAIGQMQGWQAHRERFSMSMRNIQAPSPAHAAQHPAANAASPGGPGSSPPSPHRPPALEVPSPHSASALAAQNQALSVMSKPILSPRHAQIQPIQELAPSPDIAASPEPAPEPEEEQSPAPGGAPDVPPAPANYIADSWIEGNQVLVDGLVIGTFTDDGTVVSESGDPIGLVPPELLKEMRERQAEETALKHSTVEERINRLLSVQNYHDAEDRLASVYAELFASPGKHRRKSSGMHNRKASIESQSQSQSAAAGLQPLVINVDEISPSPEPIEPVSGREISKSAHSHHRTASTGGSTNRGHGRHGSLGSGLPELDILDAASVHASALRRRSIALAEDSHSHHGHHRTHSAVPGHGVAAVSPHDVEDWVEIAVDESELNRLEDPPIGLFPEGFDEKQYEFKREAQTYSEVIPSRFSRQRLHFSFPEGEKIITTQAFFGLFQSLSFNPMAMKMLWVVDLVGFLQKAHYKSLDKAISQLVNLTVLGLPNAGITHLDVILPNLLCLDLSRNQIHHVSDIQKTLNTSIHLQALNLLDNPICDGFLESAHNHNGLPPIKSDLWLPILNAPDLTHFNSIPISNTIRAQAYSKWHNNSHLNKNVPLFLYHHALNSCPPILAMPEHQFHPEAIHSLHLENCGLFTFSVYALRHSLQELRLGHNHINSLDQSGLSFCTKLTLLDLSHNALKDSKHDFDIYPLIPSLLDLDISGNHYPNHHVEHLIYACRNLPGLNRSPGLRSLNGKVLSIEDRVQALVKVEHDRHHTKEDEYRWKLSLIHAFGSLQLRSIDGFIGRVKVLDLSNCHLNRIFGLEKFESLEVLDLSNNNLTTVDMLETLRHVRVVKLNGNKHLKEEAVMTQLASFTQLEQVWLFKEYKHSRHQRHGSSGGSSGNVLSSIILSKEAQREKELYGHISHSWFRKVLAALAPMNPKLSVIDGVAISLDERIHLHKDQNPGLSPSELQGFKLGLALLYSCTPILGRDYTPTKWTDQYAPAMIMEMNLSHLELSSDQLDFTHFHSLQYLDLSHNKITDLAAMNIRQCRNLTWLDVSNNRINTELTSIGLVVNDLTKLSVFFIRGNPCMNHRDSRLKLLSTIDRMKELGCELRVVDTVITLDEKMKSIAIGGVFSKDEVEELRFQVAVHMRGPNAELTPNSQVKEINFSDLGLRFIRVSIYPNLTKLLLAHNQLETMKGTGVDKLTSLTVLDLRHNLISDLDECIEFINAHLQKLVFLGLEGNRFGQINPSYYRKHTINNLHAMKSLEPTLLYLDDIEISGTEIADSWLAEGGDKSAVENLRYQLALHKGLHHHYTVQNIQVLDLSHSALTVIHFEGFNELRKVNLSHNHLDSESLMASKITECHKLAHIQLDHNELHSMHKIGELFNSMYSLRSLDVAHNRCFPENQPEYRQKLLSFFPNSRKRGFRLRFLNGHEITMEERIEACRIAEADSRAEEGEAEYIKTLLILESKKLDPSEKTNLLLDLSGFQLRNVYAITQFKFIQYLNLSNNNLSQLEGQGIERLRFLSTLNLRNNQFQSLELVLAMLTNCPKLQSLYLENSTVDGRTSRISDKLIHFVCKRLRGVRTLDEQRSPFQFTPSQLSALHFLHKLCGLHANHLIDIDISQLHISEDYFFYILSALSELKCCETLHAQGNQWNSSKLHALYRVYCIFALGEELKELDGFEITDSERLNALKKLNKDAANQQLLLEPWEKCGDRAMEKVNGAALMLQKIKETQAAKRAEKEKEKKNANANSGHAKEEKVDEEKKEEKAEIVGEAKMKRTAIDEKLDDMAFEDITPLVAVADEAATVAMSGDEVLWSITGTVLTKSEIAIHFLQVFDLLLLIDVEIKWPQAILDVSVWIKIFTLDIDNWFAIRVPYKQQLKFAIVMILPALCLAFYGILSTLNKNQWVSDYIENWRRTKWRAFGIWFLACLAGILLALFADPDSSSAIKDGNGVNSNTRSIIGVLIVLFSLIAFVWSWVVRTFRTHYLADQSVGKNELFVWFLDKLQWWRQVSLFFTTILFLPVARVILSQFQCWCPGDTETPITDANGVAYPFCQIEIYPGQECFPTQVTAIQIFAIVFACVYLLGIPYFFYRLIKYGVESMVDRHGYLEEAALVNEAIEQIKQDSEAHPEHGKENKKMISRLKQQLKEFYYNRVNQNRAPQTYLYAAYEREFRFWKLGQMALKLSLICISFFLPRYFLNTFKILMANIIVGGFALLSFMCRPFNSDLEDVMEVFSQIGNLVNAGFAYLIGGEKITNTTAGALLVIVNVSVIVILLIGIVFTPLFALRAKLKYKKEMKQHAASHRLVLTKLPDGKIEVKEVSAKEAIEMQSAKTPKGAAGAAAARPAAKSAGGANLNANRISKRDGPHQSNPLHYQNQANASYQDHHQPQVQAQAAAHVSRPSVSSQKNFI